MNILRILFIAQLLDLLTFRIALNMGANIYQERNPFEVMAHVGGGPATGVLFKLTIIVVAVMAYAIFSTRIKPPFTSIKLTSIAAFPIVSGLLGSFGNIYFGILRG